MSGGPAICRKHGSVTPPEIPCPRCEIEALRERAERAEADYANAVTETEQLREARDEQLARVRELEAEVERLQNMRDTIGMKLTAAEARVRELEGALGKLQQATANWAATTNAPVEVAQALYSGRAALTDTSEGER